MPNVNPFAIGKSTRVADREPHVHRMGIAMKFFARSHVVWMVALTAIIACAPPVSNVTSYSAPRPAKASADSVQIFTDVRPDRAHTELGFFDVKSSPLALKSDYGQLILEARQRAAEMGADAIVVTRRPIEHSTTTGSVTPNKKHKGSTYTESTSTSETARISVVAIAWKTIP